MKPVLTACLVLGYQNAPTLRVSSRMFRALGWDVFVHLDQKSDAFSYQAELGDSCGVVRFIAERHDIFWGGFSMIRAELDLIGRALECRDYDRLILISDDSFPVRGPDFLTRSLAREVERITCNHQPPGSDFARRYEEFFYFDHPATNPRGGRWRSLDEHVYEKLREYRDLRQAGKTSIAVFHGSQWWALTGATAVEILRICKNNVPLMKSFEFSALPDELMMQSIIPNYFPNAARVHGPVFADFSTGHGPLSYSTIGDLPDALDQDYLFVRKLPRTSSRLVGDIVRHLELGLPLPTGAVSWSPPQSSPHFPSGR